MLKNPWKTLESRMVYSNPWMRVREDQVITPKGNRGIYGVIEAKPAIGIIPLTTDLHTFLVGQYRYPLETYTWEIPEGGAETGESLLDAAKRELKEETGVEAGLWTDLGELYTSNCFTNERGFVFLAEDLLLGEAEPDPTEELQLKKVSFAEAWQMVLSQDIKDALSVIALMRVHEHLKQQNRL